jgi:hypothetical protein
MVYSVGAQCDNGPFYLTPEKRDASRKSNELLLPPEKQGEKDKTKRELVDEMMNNPLGIAEGRNALSKMLLRDLHVKRYLINYPHLSDYGQIIFCLSFPSRDRATAPGRYEQFYNTSPNMFLIHKNKFRGCNQIRLD